MRRSCLILSLLMFALCTLSGFLAIGFYLTETHILDPLTRFFRPISGDTNGTINGRAWNLLLLGSDNDQKFAFPDLLTQVMMVVRVNPPTGSVSMVSIPRDSWVSVPGRGMHKIDQAFFLGASPHHNFDDGVRLARATIEQDYGIAIDRYAWVGLDGFSSVINTLGGIDIDITHPIVDDNYPDDTGRSGKANPYAVKRLYLPPGMQHLNGDQALEYVRSRHADLVGDIGRTQRQQEILQELKKKLDMETIFRHLPELIHDLAGKVYTDLSQGELLSLANFGRNLRADAFQRFTLGPGQGNQNYGTLAQITDPGLDQSQDIILPNCATIQPVINHIFDLGDTASCKVSGSE
jgi:LCP family protein required for cell wall assembly